MPWDPSPSLQSNWMLCTHSYTLLAFWGFRVMCNSVNFRLFFHLARLKWSWEGPWVAKRRTFSLRCRQPSLGLLWFAPMNLMILTFLHMPLASHWSYCRSLFIWHLLIFSSNHTLLLVPLLRDMAKVNHVVEFLASEALIWNSQIHNFVWIVNSPSNFNLLGKLKMLPTNTLILGVEVLALKQSTFSPNDTFSNWLRNKLTQFGLCKYQLTSKN